MARNSEMTVRHTSYFFIFLAFFFGHLKCEIGFLNAQSPDIKNMQIREKNGEGELALNLDDEMDDDEFEEEDIHISDPFAFINRPIFIFNDKVYSYIFKPINRVYRKIMPEIAKACIHRFFNNLNFPPRLVNNILQVKGKGALREISRFTINSTIGLAGLFDPADRIWQIEQSREDFGQTLGKWKIPPGPYLQIPFMGPSNLRDSLSMSFDGIFTPKYYLLPHNIQWRNGVLVLDNLNALDNRIDEYYIFKKDAFDPYTFLRDAYYQFRRRQVEE